MRKRSRCCGKHAVPCDKIHIFVANEEEEGEYLQTIPPEAYHMHVAKVGTSAVRNYITAFLPVGTRLFCLDDDIKDLVELAGSHARPIEDLIAFIEAGFEEVEKRSIRL